MPWPDVMMTMLLGYLLGSLPLGFLLARQIGGVDLRQVGSGNVGATNSYRAAGWGLGITVMVVDVAKGTGAVLIAARAGAGEGGAVVAGVAAVVGHMFPVWLAGRGGKGVATACGVFAVLAPVATAVAAVTFVAGVVASRVVSVGSLLAVLALPSVALVHGSSGAVASGAAVVAALIVWRHRENIVRIRAGTERRLARSSPGGPRA
jgi:glycerol-3-phosphate acyltransferase PlsY